MSGPAIWRMLHAYGGPHHFPAWVPFHFAVYGQEDSEDEDNVVRTGGLFGGADADDF